MATPPPVTAADAQAAVDRIANRRAQIDDPNAWRLSDDPLEVLLYLQRYSVGIPQSVAAEDTLDGLTLKLRLWWIAEEAEFWLLERAHRLGVPARRVGERLGGLGRQGVRDRRRLARMKAERLTGTQYRNVDVSRSQRERDLEQEWLTAHRAEILEIAGEALRFTALANDEAAEWLADVAADVRSRLVTPGSLQVLRFALIELGGSEAVQHAAAEHPVHALLQRWSALYGSRREGRPRPRGTTLPTAPINHG